MLSARHLPAADALTLNGVPQAWGAQQGSCRLLVMFVCTLQTPCMATLSRVQVLTRCSADLESQCDVGYGASGSRFNCCEAYTYAHQTGRLEHGARRWASLQDFALFAREMVEQQTLLPSNVNSNAAICDKASAVFDEV